MKAEEKELANLIKTHLPECKNCRAAISQEICSVCQARIILDAGYSKPTRLPTDEGMVEEIAMKLHGMFYPKMADWEVFNETSAHKTELRQKAQYLLSPYLSLKEENERLKKDIQKQTLEIITRDSIIKNHPDEVSQAVKEERERIRNGLLDTIDESKWHSTLYYNKEWETFLQAMKDGK